MFQVIFDSPATYRICVHGTLDQGWSERLSGMTITNTSDDDGFAVATLTGRLVDQAALVGALTSLYGLGLPLLTVECLGVHQRQANAELERASQLKSEYLATMSHEIRTPLHRILSLADLLLATPLDAQQQEYAIALRAVGNTLHALIGDILDLSKIEAGHLELESQPFDPRQLVAEVIEALRPQADAKGLVMASLVESDVPARLRGDAARLRQVLTNLLGNAIKFTEQGDVALGVRLVEQANGEVLVDWAVSDTGIGIAPEALPHLFDAFRQVDAATTRRYGGTGLGLAICRRLVTAMGGRDRGRQHARGRQHLLGQSVSAPGGGGRAGRLR